MWMNTQTPIGRAASRRGWLVSSRTPITRTARARLWLNSIICAAFILPSGLASFGTESASPSWPKLKRTVVRMESPRGAEQTASFATVATVTPHVPPSALFWEYPLPLPRDVMFDILKAPTSDGPWTKIGETNKPPFPVSSTGPEGYYKTETRNL